MTYPCCFGQEDEPCSYCGRGGSTCEVDLAKIERWLGEYGFRCAANGPGNEYRRHDTIMVAVRSLVEPLVRFEARIRAATTMNGVRLACGDLANERRALTPAVPGAARCPPGCRGIYLGTGDYSGCDHYSGCRCLGEKCDCPNHPGAADESAHNDATTKEK